jgi:hypothetical protein
VPPVHSPTPLWPTLSFGYRDIAFRNITISVAMFMGLPPMKPRYGIPRVNLTALAARIYGSAPPELLTFWEYSLYPPCSSVRSDGLRKFVNPPQRILTVRSSLVIPANDQVFLHKLSTCGANLRRLLNTPRYKLLCIVLQQFSKALSFLIFSHDSASFRRTLLHALLAADLQTLSRV